MIHGRTASAPTPASGRATGVSRPAPGAPTVARAPRRRRLRLPVLRRTALADLVFLVVLLVIVRDRYRTLANGSGLSGYDPGNWLAFGNSLLGHGVRAPGVTYPPVVPLLSKAFYEVWGATVGLARLAALCSAAPAVGLYVVLRAQRRAWSGLFVATLLAASASVGEATAWGGYPQLLGLGLLPLAVWCWQRFLRDGRWTASACTGALLVLQLGISHFLAIATAVAIFAVTALALVASPDRRETWSRRRTAWVALVPVVPVLPLYWSFGSAVGSSETSRNGLLTNPFSGVRLDELEFITRESPTLWKLVFLALPASLLLVRSRCRDATWQLALAVFASTVFLMALLGDARVIYLYPISALAAAVVWLDVVHGALRRHVRRDRIRAVCAASMVVALCAASFVQIRNGRDFFRIQRTYYGIVDLGIEEGLQWISQNTARDAIVATPPIQGGPWGWWIEGLGERKALVGSKLQWLNFEDEQTRAVESAEIFAAIDSDDAFDLARSFGVGYLFIPQSADGFGAARLAATAARHADAVVFRNDSIVILKTAA